ncbi:MAG: hypothetical protein JWR68_1202 [Polaromonas sp.]|nr:hypothetical protein [Polaromonas sp.]
MFAPGGDVFMPGNMRHRVGLQKRGAQARQGFVLRRLERVAFKALEFDADRVVIALTAFPVKRLARVPGAITASNKLPQRARARDEKVRGNLQPPYALEIGMRVPFQLIAEKALHIAIAKLPWRQTD